MGSVLQDNQRPTEALMMQVKASRIVLFALVATLAACGDAVAPRTAAPDADPVLSGGVTTALTRSDTVKFTITIDPRQPTRYDLGEGNSLVFPAGSVCDPTKSTYGVTEWDKPCEPARRTVAEHVKAWLDADGHPRVDFSPNIRFVPSPQPNKWVVITFSDYSASLDAWYNILYCPTDTSACYDESKTDPSLATNHDPVSGKVTRRIKHFSGYLVGAGDDDGSGGSFNRIQSGSKLPPVDKAHSGYILVSGRK
jgi:hypothetical protein